MNYKIIVIIGVVFTILFLSGCLINEPKKRTYVCWGELDDVFTDGTMASLDFVNGSCRGIIFYGSPHERYDSFDFELLEKGAVYTFVFHLEDDVARPGIDMYYIDDAPVIDDINRGNHSEYWMSSRGCIKW